MGKKRKLMDEYRFPGFRPRAEIQGIFGDSKARIIRVERTQKKRFVDAAEKHTEAITTRECGGYGICPVEMRGFIWRWKFGGYYAGGVER